MNLDRLVPRLAGTAQTLLAAHLVARDLPALTPARRRSASLFTLSEVAADLLDRLGVEVEVRGQVPATQSLLVANHLSWLDPLLVVPSVPCVCLAKREMFDWPLIGDEARAFGMIMVDRRDAATRAVALRRARRVLMEGWSVLNFPEGTTSAGDRVLRFHRGLFGVALTLGVPIVPVHVAYADRAACWVGDETFLPHFLRLVGRAETKATLTFGAEVRPTAIDSPETLAARARRHLARGLHS